MSKKLVLLTVLVSSVVISARQEASPARKGKNEAAKERRPSDASSNTAGCFNTLMVADNGTIAGEMNVLGKFTAATIAASTIDFGGTAKLTPTVVNQLLGLLNQPSFGNFTNTDGGNISAGNSVPFATNGQASTIDPVTSSMGGTLFTVPAAGKYSVNWNLTPTSALAGQQLQLFANGVAVPGTQVGAVIPNTQISGNSVVNVPGGPFSVELRNISGAPLGIAMNTTPSLQITRIS